MKNYFVVLVTLLSIAIAHHSGVIASPSQDTNSPTQVVKQLIGAMDQNDATAIRASFSKDATQLYDRWYAREKSGTSFWEWLESDIIETHGKVIDTNYLNKDDTSVVVTGTFKNNEGYQSPADFLFTVESGKITSWTIRYD